MGRYDGAMSGPTDLDRLVSEYTRSIDDSASRLSMRLVRMRRPMWPRMEFEPGHFTASGFVAAPDRERMLLIRHGRLDRWLQPGGHIEADDETVEAAAGREVAEETGITDLRRIGQGLVRIDAHVIPPRDDEPAHTHVDLGIGFVAGSDVIGPLDEVLDAVWVPFGDLASFDTDDALGKGAAALSTLLTD